MLVFSDVTIRRGSRVLLSDFTAAIHAGQKVGVTGRNGTGKSTLFALIRGELSADKGEFVRPQRLSIAHLAQETPALPQSALDYVLDGDAELRRIQNALATAEAAQDAQAQAQAHEQLHAVDGYTAPARAARLLAGLGFADAAMRKPVADFSGGWRMRLNLAQCLMCRSELLLLDEPTNHLDLDTVLWLAQELERYSGTLLIISHDRDFLDGFSTHTLHLERATATLYTGNYSASEAQRAEQMRQQAKEYEAQKRRLGELQRFVDRFKAKASKARQAQSRVKQIEKIQLVEPAHWASPFSFAFAPPERLPSPLIQAEQLRCGYLDGQAIIDGARFSLEPGDRVGILGPNGAGKSTLVKTIAGQLPAQGGKLERDERLSVGYFHQHQVDALQSDWSPIKHLQDLAPMEREQSLRNFLGGFDFHGDRVFEAVGDFSGGEKARLALALLVWQKPNLLLLDEPTNHLDLEMRHALELALLDYPGAVILVAHDRHLLATCCESLWLVHDGALAVFDGDLDDYARWLQRNSATGDKAGPSAKAENSAPSAAERRRLAAEQRQREQPLRKAIKQAEQQMQTASTHLTTLEQELADPELYSADPSWAADLAREQGEWRKRLEAAEERWMMAAEELEALRQS
nr:ATP-binding cassette domain-containing protein [Oceanococcus sp. HetDA_MAG_MS8]